jgi:hypothetical protein
MVRMMAVEMRTGVWLQEFRACCDLFIGGERQILQWAIINFCHISKFVALYSFLTRSSIVFRENL